MTNRNEWPREKTVLSPLYSSSMGLSLIGFLVYLALEQRASASGVDVNERPFDLRSILQDYLTPVSISTLQENTVQPGGATPSVSSLPDSVKGLIQEANNTLDDAFEALSSHQHAERTLGESDFNFLSATEMQGDRPDVGASLVSDQEIVMTSDGVSLSSEQFGNEQADAVLPPPATSSGFSATPVAFGVAGLGLAAWGVASPSKSDPSLGPVQPEPEPVTVNKLFFSADSSKDNDQSLKR